jgi:Predicted membrane protein
MMRYGSYGYGMMGFGWGFIMMAGILIVFILGILALIRFIQRTGPNSSGNMRNTALEILNERYARGEITDEEYKQKKAEIKS